MLQDEHGPAAPSGNADPDAMQIASTRALSEVRTGDFVKMVEVPGRLYLPTLADLIDRLSITQLKEIYLPDHAAEYRDEQRMILHDIDLLLRDRDHLGAEDVRMVMLIMLANRVIWENESRARAGGADQDHLLKFTHSINGVRNAAKNALARAHGERLDFKVDCFAEHLAKDFGNWDVIR